MVGASLLYMLAHGTKHIGQNGGDVEITRRRDERFQLRLSRKGCGPEACDG